MRFRRLLRELLLFFALLVLFVGCDSQRFSRSNGQGPGGQRSVTTSLYVWSEEFRRLNNDVLIGLAQARNIDRLIASAGHNTPMGKLRRLQRRARRSGLRVELLLASNHWVRPGGVERAKTRLKTLDLHGSPLHLDVEPHALEDFDQRRDEYLQRYLEVLRVAHRSVGDNELAVSVPLFWPDRVYREIGTIVDRVYLMAYGEKRTPQRADQILEVARYFYAGQRAVALRPEDFAHPRTLDRAIPALQEAVETNQFALHDLESFLRFTGGRP